MKTKVCFKCDTELPIVNFYKHPKMADGHLGKCKACTRYDVRQNRLAKRDYYNAYDRERGKNPERVAAMVAGRDRQKYLARVAVQNAVKRGKMTKQPCEQCGDPMVEAHHPDYTKRLDVVWLCRKHHAVLHRTVEE